MNTVTSEKQSYGIGSVWIDPHDMHYYMLSTAGNRLGDLLYVAVNLNSGYRYKEPLLNASMAVSGLVFYADEVNITISKKQQKSNGD